MNIWNIGKCLVKRCSLFGMSLITGSTVLYSPVIRRLCLYLHRKEMGA